MRNLILAAGLMLMLVASLILGLKVAAACVEPSRCIGSVLYPELPEFKSIVETAPVTFQWSVYPDATEYTLKVRSKWADKWTKFKVPSSACEGISCRFTTPDDMKFSEGTMYIWRVHTKIDDHKAKGKKGKFIFHPIGR